MDDVVCFVARPCCIGGEHVRAGEFVNINRETGAVTICRSAAHAAELTDRLADGCLTVLRGDLSSLPPAQPSPRLPMRATPQRLALLR